MKRILAFAAVACAFYAAHGGSASAEEWAVLGSRAKSMGGTGVASAEMPYWNPAFPSTKLFSFDRIELWAPFSIEFTTQGGIMAEVDDIYDIMNEMGFDDIQASLNSGTADLKDIQTALRLVSELDDLNRRGQGLFAYTIWSASLRLGQNASVFWNTAGYFGVKPRFDLGPLSALADGGFLELFNTIGTGSSPSTPEGQALRDALVAELGPGITLAQANEFAYIAEQTLVNLGNPETLDSLIAVAQATLSGASSPQETLYYNQSGLVFSGLIVHEYGLDLSAGFMDGVVSVGVGIKFMRGVTFERSFFIRDAMENEDMENFINIPDDVSGYAKAYLNPARYLNVASETTNTFGIDAGVLVKLGKMLNIGLTAKNLNSPKFKLPSGRNIELETQIRAGVLFTPFKMLKAALDYDILKAKSYVLDGFYSQLLCVGVEFSPFDNSLFGLHLRIGGYKNIAEDNDDFIGTIGFGLRLLVVQLDLGAAVSTDTVTYVGKKTKSSDLTDPNGWRDLHEHMPERISFAATLSIVIKIGD